MGLAWSSREGWGRAGIPNPFPPRCSFSALLGLGRVAVSESCVLVRSPDGTCFPKSPVDSREGWQDAVLR